MIGGILGVLGGGAVLSSTGSRQEEWLSAATLGDLPENEPTAITLSRMRLDGYREALERRTVFLVRTGENNVTAFDATCTHLGCRVDWNAQTQSFICPCHGGVFDRTGAVTDGPPPEPLMKIATKVDGDKVLVQT